MNTPAVAPGKQITQPDGGNGLPSFTPVPGAMSSDVVAPVDGEKLRADWKAQRLEVRGGDAFVPEIGEKKE